MAAIHFKQVQRFILVEKYLGVRGTLKITRTQTDGFCFGIY